MQQNIESNNIYSFGNDPFAKYLDKLVTLLVTFRSKPIKGRMVRLDPDFVEVQRLSGNETMVRRSSILGINEARCAQGVMA